MCRVSPYLGGVQCHEIAFRRLSVVLVGLAVRVLGGCVPRVGRPVSIGSTVGPVSSVLDAHCGSGFVPEPDP